MSKCYYRYFTDNDKYGERKTPYLDSLAFIIQEFLYSKDKAKQEIIYKERVFDNYTMTTHTNKKTKSFDCEMDGRIQLYDFVTMTLHLINTLPSDFAKVQLKEYLADLKKKDGISYREEISRTQNGIYLYNTSKEMIFALLWAAWIYMKVFLDLNPNKMLEKCVDMLYDAMKENYPSTAENLEKHPLIAHAPAAMALMCQHIQAKAKKSKSNKSSDKEHAEDNSGLQARINELQKENESLNKQLEEYRNQQKANETQEVKNDEWIVELLSHLCYGEEQVARDILDDIRGKEDPVIADIIVERKEKNQISPKTQNRELWKILHAAKLYRGIEGNFNTALRRRQQR